MEMTVMTVLAYQMVLHIMIVVGYVQVVMLVPQ